MAKITADEKYMRLAIAEARKNLKALTGGPFGACIVRQGKVVAVSRNTVLKNDATCHAEMNAIRLASRKLKTYDLSGCVIYSTTEPCPMCFSAIHWAKIKRIVFATTTADAAKVGFNELRITDKELKRIGKSRVILSRSRLIKECQELFLQWQAMPNRKLY